MSEPADGEGAPDAPPEPGPAPADAVPAPSEVPPTRRHTSTHDAQLELGGAPMQFPDDGPLSRTVRQIDHVLGRVEQGVVFGLLALVVTVAALAALHDRIFAAHIGRWWHYIVRGGTFAIAMFAAVYTTQQQRHLAMDLVSRRLSPRGRLILGLGLKLLTIGVMILLFRSGLHQREVAGGNESLALPGFHINDADIVTTISIGAALIGLHALLHLVIDIDYLVRGKLPPERARSGH
ncbi:MAG TPA: TRAP transporter small permease subunit [Kofleriaceae bacterium]